MQFKFISSLITILILYCSSIFFKGFANSFLDEPNCYFFLISLYICVLCYLAISLFFTSKKISLKKIDLFMFGAWVLFGGAVAITPNIHFSDDGIILIHSLFLLFFILRRVLYSDAVIRALCFILVSGFVFELVAGIYDLTNVRISEINNLSIQGTFYNSGIYIAYVVGLTPFVLLLLLNLSSKWLARLLLFFCAGIISFLLIVTESRASAIGMITVTLGFYLYNKRGYRSWLFKGIPLVAFILLIGGAMLFKQSSSAGRWLIWKITFQSFSSRPLFGYGPATFSKLYPQWQAKYFMHSDKQNVKYQMLADVTHVAFNEYLQILAETGLVGLILFIVLILLIIKLRTDPERNKLMSTFKATIFFFLIFAAFSYPFHIAPMLVIFVFSLAAITGLSNENPVQLSLPRKALLVSRLMIILPSVYMINWLYKHAKAVMNWEYIDQVAVNDERAYLKDYHKIYSTLKSCSPFLLNYGEVLLINRDAKNAICVLKNANEIYATEKGYILLGNAYQLNKNYEAAEQCYKTLTAMVPAHFKPKYLLVNIYMLKNDSLDAQILAKQIVDMPVKVPSDEIFQMKLEMKNLVHKNK